MESYFFDWLQLIFRWLHVITGIAWIGASFYFVWLDNSLEEPPQWKKDKGIKGDLWSIHGGGIYEVAKYELAPEKMPETLHWFKWEAYTTWLTGMVLLIVIFYLGADSYLIDKRVADLTQLQAVGLGMGFLISGWVIYEVLCNTPLAKNGFAIAGVLISIAVIYAYALTHLFSGRGAYIHMGAVIGTIMVGNVFRVIMPSQRALVAAIEKGEAPDPAWGIKAKLHSTHNNYLTLPLLFIMISNHYPMTYSHEYSWLVLLAIIAITAFARHYFNLQHKGINRPIILVVSAIAAATLAFVISPKPSNIAASNDSVFVASQIAQVKTILTERCASCHSARPSDEVFTAAPLGMMLDTLDEMQRWASRIKARSVDTADMPFMNKTEMTDEERGIIGAWVAAGAPTK
ncbi:MAG: urate hydroxylase PuuD [Halioglobus sp.]